MDSDKPTHREWAEIYTLVALTVSFLLLSGACLLVAGYALGIYSAFIDIPSASPPTPVSQAVGCLLPVTLIVLGGAVINAGIYIGKKLRSPRSNRLVRKNIYGGEIHYLYLIRRLIF